VNVQELLDSSIVEPPPPFAGIDGLIARERRRLRLHRLAAAGAATAGVVAVVLGVGLVAGPLDGDVRTPNGPAADPTTAGTASIPDLEFPEDRYARLSELLRARVDAVLPGASVVSANPTRTELFGESDGVAYGGYDLAEATVTASTPTASAGFTVYVVRPLVPPRTQPTAGVAGRLFGGCAGEWSTATPEPGSERCEDRVGPGGTAVSVAERAFGGGSVLMVTVAFPEGGVVTLITPADTPLAADALVELIADPGYVAGAAAPPYTPATVEPTDTGALRTLPADAVPGTAYPFDLYTHCGVDLVQFAGRAWRAEPADDGTLPGPYLAGTMELLDHATARFVIDQRYVQTNREVIVFSWVPDATVPLCA
jgi:hypothetical protein